MRAERGAFAFNLWDVFPLVWLVWLVFPVQTFLAKAHSPAEHVLYWGSLVGFVGLYLRAFLPRRPDDRWAYGGWVAALALWGLWLWLYGPSAFTFLIYGGSLIGWQRSGKLAAAGAGFNFLLMLGLILAQGGKWADLIYPVFVLVAAYGTHGSYTSHQARRRLVAAQAEQERLAAEAERERIARDLHDLLGHTLSVIVLKSELAGKLAEKHPARAAEEIREVERISREALQEVRSAVQGYRGSGLSAELARAKVALDAAGVKLSLRDPAPPLAPAAEASAAMLLREAVTNVVRHARAREVEVAWVRGAGGIQLVIQDDGVGGLAPEGTGLNSMRERLRAIGGTLERDGTRGTRLVATFPQGERLP